MAKTKKTSTTKNDDWRGVINKGKSKAKTVSWRARFRIFFVRLKYALIAMAVMAIIYACYHLYSTAFFDDIFGVGSKKISRIEFKTDGVITPEWIGRYIKLSRSTKLADVNIFAVKNALENLTQIKSATVERVYPDKLRVTINEHKPIAKAIAEIDMRTVLYLISPEGVFYEPICLNESYVKNLPQITGYNLKFNGRTPQNLKCADKIMEFLAYSQSKRPMDSWGYINVKELESVVPLISATTKEGIKIIFAPKDYPKQFDRLEYVLRYSKENKLQDIKQIDLSLKERADVKLKSQKK